MMEILWRAKQPYNVTTASQVVAVAAMQNLEYIQVRGLDGRRMSMHKRVVRRSDASLGCYTLTSNRAHFH